MLISKVIAKKSQSTLNSIKDKQFLKDLLDIDIVAEIICILCMVVNATNLFYIKPEEREHADKTKFEKLSDEGGDFFFFQHIYSSFIKLYHSKDNKKLNDWIYNHYLSKKTLNQVRELEREIMQIIRVCSINEEELKSELIEAEAKLMSAKSVREVLLSCLVSSFATNLALYSGN